MQPATWPTAHDVQGWKCNNAECGEWRDFSDAFEGEEHRCSVEPWDCEHCEGKGWGYIDRPYSEAAGSCPAGCDNGKVPAKGVFTEAFA